MAHFHIKKKKGRPYLYVREIARVNGKPKVVEQTYIGPPERVRSLAKGEGPETTTLKVQEYGSLWLANQMDKDIDLVHIIDSVMARSNRETGPSIGEYFLYCVWNRMIKAVSKNKLADWYRDTAVQNIRPVKLTELTSQRYWEKWDRVSEQDLRTIAEKFFQKIWQLEKPNADCLLFDTTNFYTFMASKTTSELAQRGNNKQGRHHLRQIGLGLLVERNSRLPLYYSVYPGNVHDSKLFEGVMDKMFGIVCGLGRTKERMTVVIDKGMNSEGNYAWIDGHSRVHFVTTYSTYFAQDLATTNLDKFEPVDTEKNRTLVADGKEDDITLAYRTKGEYWGKERAVVVTHNPATARKQEYTLLRKLETLRCELLQMRAKVRERAPHWRDAEAIRERYIKICARLHLPSNLYRLEFTGKGQAVSMGFRKDPYHVARKKAMFGKNIIITDNTDWSTKEIVEASLDRWRVENAFRRSKGENLVGTRPVRHWTDGKIQCHLFSCVVALTYLRRLEIRLHKSGIGRTVEDVMDDMCRLHSVLTIKKGKRKPIRRLETPTKTQSEVLKAFDRYIDDRGVLRHIPK